MADVEAELMDLEDEIIEETKNGDDDRLSKEDFNFEISVRNEIFTFLLPRSDQT